MQEKKPFLQGLAAGALLVLVIVGIFRMVQDHSQSAAGPLSETTRQKLEAINELVSEKYLNEVDEQSLTDHMIAGYMEGLGDDYAAYYTAEEYKELLTSTSGSYSGIGLVMSQDPDTQQIIVIGCYEGYGAEKAGIEAGDILLTVDDMDATDIDINILAAGIRNSENATVHVVWSHDGTEKEADVEKSDVEIPSVAYEMKDGNIGYIRLTKFTTSAADQFKEAYDDLTGQGMTSLIVDLRDNPGGLMDSVIAILNNFMPEGTMVYMVDKDGNRTDYTCDGKTPIDIPLTVLVNENSASASEIFAGAVKDYGVGTIVGVTTYGKGIVQQTFELTDGSAVKMTMARYYTPNGTCIQGTGITPDVVVETQTEEEKEAEEKAEEEAAEEAAQEETVDHQLDKALEIAKAS